MRRRLVAALAIATCALAACVPSPPQPSPSIGSSSEAPTAESSATDDDPAVLTIGIPADHPGLGTMLATGPTGFEPALANEIAARLGAEAELVPLALDQRIRALRNGDVEIVLSSLQMNYSNESQIDLAGPYLVVHQDMLMAAGETEWEGMALCAVQNTRGLERAQLLYADDTLIYPAETYSGCVEMLSNGTVAVVTGDDAVLAGFVARHPGRMALVGESLAITRYGVGLPPGSTELCEQVNAALTEIVADGTWEALRLRYFGATYVPDPTLNPPHVGTCSGEDETT